MKKKYTKPTLTTHGNVESITQVLGEDKTEDFLIFNGNLEGTSDDSRDFIINTNQGDKS